MLETAFNISYTAKTVPVSSKFHHAHTKYLQINVRPGCSRLNIEIFHHGQLHVAFSSLKRISGLKANLDEDGLQCGLKRDGVNSNWRMTKIWMPIKKTRFEEDLPFVTGFNLSDEEDCERDDELDYYDRILFLLAPGN